MDGADRAEAVGAAAQDRGIAGLQAQRAGIGGDIGPALIDDADDAERHPDALDAHAVGAPPRRQHGADRIRRACGWRRCRPPWPRRAPASRVSRSRKAALAPADFASATSSALAARMAARAPRMALAMAASARFFCAAGASASTCAAARAARRCRASSRRARRRPRRALSGSVHGTLIRLAFAAFLPCSGGPARRPDRRLLSTAYAQPFAGRRKIRRNMPIAMAASSTAVPCGTEGAMSSVSESLRVHRCNRPLSRSLPKRFPVGAKYVIEDAAAASAGIARIVALRGIARRPAHQCSGRSQPVALAARRSARQPRRETAAAARPS